MIRKSLLGGFAILFLSLMCAGGLQAQPRPSVRLFLAPHSTVAPPDILKYTSEKCPNVSLTVNSRQSDYMLQAWGWSGNYKFTLFRRGGQAVYSTSTMRLSNAVKDVCRYIDSNPPR